jgi:hypothetical protein
MASSGFPTCSGRWISFHKRGILGAVTIRQGAHPHPIRTASSGARRAFSNDLPGPPKLCLHVWPAASPSGICRSDDKCWFSRPVLAEWISFHKRGIQGAVSIRQGAPPHPIRTASAGARRAFSNDLPGPPKLWLHVLENTPNKVAARGTISLASRPQPRDEWSCKGTL